MNAVRRYIWCFSYVRLQKSFTEQLTFAVNFWNFSNLGEPKLSSLPDETIYFYLSVHESDVFMYSISDFHQVTFVTPKVQTQSTHYVTSRSSRKMANLYICDRKQCIVLHLHCAVIQFA